MSEKDNGKMSNKEMIETVIALEEGKKQGLTPFQIGIAMGIKKHLLQTIKAKMIKRKDREEYEKYLFLPISKIENNYINSKINCNMIMFFTIIY